MKYRFVRGGPAQGEIEAIGDLVSNDVLKRTRQVQLKIRISSAAEGSEVGALFTEVVEGDFTKDAELATERNIRDAVPYDVLFGHIEAALPK